MEITAFFRNLFKRERKEKVRESDNHPLLQFDIYVSLAEATAGGKTQQKIGQYKRYIIQNS
jgi:hypothetical protein